MVKSSAKKGAKKKSSHQHSDASMPADTNGDDTVRIPVTASSSGPLTTARGESTVSKTPEPAADLNSAALNGVNDTIVGEGVSNEIVHKDQLSLTASQEDKGGSVASTVCTSAIDLSPTETSESLAGEEDKGDRPTLATQLPCSLDVRREAVGEPREEKAQNALVVVDSSACGGCAAVHSLPVAGVKDSSDKASSSSPTRVTSDGLREKSAEEGEAKAQPSPQKESYAIEEAIDTSNKASALNPPTANLSEVPAIGDRDNNAPSLRCGGEVSNKGYNLVFSGTHHRQRSEQLEKAIDSVQRAADAATQAANAANKALFELNALFTRTGGEVLPAGGTHHATPFLAHSAAVISGSVGATRPSCGNGRGDCDVLRGESFEFGGESSLDADAAKRSTLLFSEAREEIKSTKKDERKREVKFPVAAAQTTEIVATNEEAERVTERKKEKLDKKDKRSSRPLTHEGEEGKRVRSSGEAALKISPPPPPAADAPSSPKSEGGDETKRRSSSKKEPSERKWSAMGVGVLVYLTVGYCLSSLSRMRADRKK